MEKDLELALEVQVDPESKKILSNPYKCNSELLDVTIVKPNDHDGSSGFPKTSTLRAYQVRKLLTSLERERRENQKILDNLKNENAFVQIKKHKSHHVEKKSHHRRKLSRSKPEGHVDIHDHKNYVDIKESVQPLFCEIRRSLKNVEARISNMHESDMMVSHTTLEKTSTDDYTYRRRKTASSYVVGEHLRDHLTYRADKAIYDLKSALRCKNNKTLTMSKMEGKCVCENCGIVGMLAECPKNPIFDESERPLPASSNSKKRAKFAEKASFLDEYMSQEQTSEINRLCKRLQNLEERLAMQEERSVPKDYFRKVLSRMTDNFSTKTARSKSDFSVYMADLKQPNKEKILQSQKKHFLQTPIAENINCFHAKVSFDNKKPEKYVHYLRTDKSTITDDFAECNGNIWRWGEEILRPGIDLKNRIFTLLTEMLSKFNISEKHHMEKPFSTYPKSNHSLPKTLDPKVYNAHMYQTNAGSSKNRDDTKYKQSQMMNKDFEMSYMNPKINQLPGKMFHGRFKDNNKPTMMLTRPSESDGKYEFLRIISKAKQSQKQALWNNIWVQAVANGQGRDDKITVKIPIGGNRGYDSSEMFETELTIKEIEDVLMKNDVRKMSCL